MLEGLPTPLATETPSSEASRNSVRGSVASSCSSAATSGFGPGCTSPLIASEAARSALVTASSTLIVIDYPPSVSKASLRDLGILPYGEALELQRSLSVAVAEGEKPDTVLLVEHPPVITTGR